MAEGEEDEKSRMTQPQFQAPTAKRQCRDVPCLILFVLFWFGMFVIAVIAVKTGNPRRISHSYDSFGNICGIGDNEFIPNAPLSGLDMTAKRFLMFYDAPSAVKFVENQIKGEVDKLEIIKDFTKREVTDAPPIQKVELVLGDPTSAYICVETCPQQYMNTVQQLSSVFELTQINYCLYNTTGKDIPKLAQSQHGPCPKEVMPSTPIFNRCIPGSANLTEEIVDRVAEWYADIIAIINMEEVASNAMSDLTEGWKEILIMCAIAFTVALVMMVLVGLFAEVLIYLFAVGSVLALAVITGFFWVSYAMEYKSLQAANATLDVEEANLKTTLIYSIVISVIFVFFTSLVIFIMPRVKLMISLFKECSKATIVMFTILLMPVLLVVVEAAFFIYWCIITGYLYTTSTPQVLTNGYVTYRESDTMKYVWILHFVGLIWGSQFLIACHETALASVYSNYYWSQGKQAGLCMPIFRAIWHVFRYHLGSVAFGSFIITLVKIPQIIIGYIYYKTKNTQSEVGRYALKCCMCCLWCFEKIIKYFTTNTYIEMAVYGQSFCTSAKRVFALLVENSARAATITFLGDFCLFLGKVMVVAITGIIGMCLLKGNENIHYWTVPTFFACLFGFIIVSAFFSVYEVGVETLFICFLEDEKNFGGSFMSENMKNVMIPDSVKVETKI